MIDAALRAEIAARVRLEHPAPGRRRISASSLAHELAGRAPRAQLIEAIKDARAASKHGNVAQHPDAPALVRPSEMFECAAKKMRLTRAGCYRLWRCSKENEPMPWEGRAACVGCAVGATNAGFAPSPVARFVQELKIVCSRCRCRTSRMINEKFCVSCYNRHGEALRGRNARGGRPRLCDFLFTVAVIKMSGSDVALLVDHHVTSATETMMAAARQAVVPLRFGWAPRGPGDVVDLA